MNGKPNWNGARLNRNAEKPIYVRIGKNWQNKIGPSRNNKDLVYVRIGKNWQNKIGPSENWSGPNVRRC